jgi:CheY-like chemotaxis protein
MSKKILVLLDNLFFAAKINGAAARTGTEIRYARTAREALELASAEKPSMMIVDLDAAGCSPLTVIAEIRKNEGLNGISILGFVSHVNQELQEKAREAGCDRVLARSAFARDLVTLLDKTARTDYGNLT